jgi:hypothetical protein
VVPDFLSITRACASKPKRKDAYMKLVKKTAEYSIFKRGDERYAVKGPNKQAINGDEKVQILLAEGLIAVAAPAAQAEPEPEAVEEVAEAPAEEAAEEVAEAAPEAEAAAEEPAGEAPAAEEAAADEADKA